MPFLQQAVDGAATLCRKRSAGAAHRGRVSTNSSRKRRPFYPARIRQKPCIGADALCAPQRRHRSNDIAGALRQKIEQNNRMMTQMGIAGTPAVFYRDRGGKIRRVVGMPAPDLLKRKYCSSPRVEVGGAHQRATRSHVKFRIPSVLCRRCDRGAPAEQFPQRCNRIDVEIRAVAAESRRHALCRHERNAIGARRSHRLVPRKQPIDPVLLGFSALKYIFRPRMRFT